MPESNVKSNSPATDESNHPTVFVDLGKQKRKRVKKLRKGKGPLMGKVEDVIEELRNSGTLTGDAQPVVIVVRQKKKNSFGLFR